MAIYKIFLHNGLQTPITSRIKLDTASNHDYHICGREINML